MSKQNKTKVIGTILLLTLLSGCSSLNSKFDCPMHSGISCKSISEINDLVDKRLAKDQNNNKEINNLTKEVLNQERPLAYFTQRGTTYHLSGKVGHKDNRMPVWMAPYEDLDGNFYHQNYVMLKIDTEERK